VGDTNADVKKLPEWQQLLFSDLTKERLEKMPMTIPMDPRQLCLGKMFNAEKIHPGKGITIFENFRFMSMNPMACIGWGVSLSFTLAIELVTEIDFPGQPDALHPGERKIVTVTSKLRISLVITPASIGFEAAASLRLKAVKPHTLNPINPKP
jgi:hypothetical protein